MAPLTLGRKVCRPRAFTARPDDLRQRSYSPWGLTMRLCAWCSRTHATVNPTGPAHCQTIAQLLAQKLSIRRSPTMPRRTMTPESLRDRWINATQRLTSAQAALAQAEADLRTLRGWAGEDGLSRELRALEMPPQPTEIKREETMMRCRALQSWSGEFEKMDYDTGSTGDILDLPRTLARTLSAGGIVEQVDVATPLYRQPEGGPNRTGAPAAANTPSWNA